MTSRREFVIGGACVLAAGSAYAATPRDRMSLLGKAKLEDIIPQGFGIWSEMPSSGVVTPESDDSLAARLYAQTVTRTMINPAGHVVMALLVYGDTQSDQLQLHRPEVCYPAFGFSVVESVAVDIPLANGVAIPSRRMTATSQLRTEHIAYWSRIGEALPQSGDEQRIAKLRLAFRGIIPDGILVRISNLEPTVAEGFALNARFAADLIASVRPAGRPVLIGSALSAKLGR